MKRNILGSLVIVLVVALSSAYDYPKSRVEREIDEMGSIVGTDGIHFRSTTKQKNKSTAKISGNVNEYLFEAAKAILSIGEIDVADNNRGIVMTSWYYTDDSETRQAKLAVVIDSQVISPEGINVIALQRTKVKGQWQEAEANPKLASDIENKILRKARNLYLSQRAKE